ncbi:molecular chaperone DnaJ [Streptomyces sp. CB02009]|uniref:caspase, EACC1-associated type n=1 Tax=Streptomyces sp. CB02009 TaxID=1703938 RepID=UPI00093AE964|nr:PQQ-binding-like beta-propeller repeat protein [Streptomyces sp. CB02009]OKJ62216.1 molecular chaperone DnaJ [Streptomyces sp. CB02009]
MTTQSFGNGNRGALLIGTGTYDHPELPALRSPEVDCTRLDTLLRDPEIGAFEVQTLIDADRSTLERAIAEFFLTAWGDDVRLLYLSCHGILSRNDKLHFAIRQTDPERPAYTTISAAYIHDVMEECRARSIVVILDCCYSGLFLPGAKSDESARFEEALAGHGRVVITAGTRSQRTWEGHHPDADTPAPSLFTGMLIEGISSGAADLNGDGFVTLQELYRYACERLHQEGAAQNPRMGGEIQYDIALAKVRKKRKQRSSDRADGQSRRSAGTKSQHKPEPWQTRAASGPAQQPVLSDGLLVVHEAYRLHVMDPESRQRRGLIKMRYSGSPALYRDNAYFPGKDGRLYAVDLRTGKPRASHPILVRDGLLSVSKDVLYAPAQNGSLYAFDPSTLRPLWSLPINKLTIVSRPQAAAGYVLFMARDSQVSGATTGHGADRIVAVSKGREAWSYITDAPLSPNWAVTDQGVYAVVQPNGPSAPQSIVALAPESGQLIWSFDTNTRLASAPVVADGTLIFGGADRRLVALDTRTKAHLWAKKTEGLLLHQPFIAGDTLFTADRAAKVTGWKLPTGRRVRSHDLLVSPDPQGSPAISDGFMYVTSSQGDVHALPI